MTGSRFLGLIPGPDARAMTFQEIEKMEDAYASAALRAKRAGFDAILLDGGAGYGIAQFMSPYINKRTDEYGGDLEGRMRFPLRIIEKVKAQVGDDYPLLFDLPANEFVNGGIKPDEARVMAQMLEKAGILAFRIHVGLWETYYYVAPPACIPRAVHVEMAKGIKDSLTQAKMMLGHRINSPEVAEQVLEKNQADVILLGRPLIADPEFPKKVAEGRPEDIQKCIACNTGCVGKINMGLPATCTVNPIVGREKECQILPAEKPKKVFIIGGGVGGMEAARVAALRGHRVTLLEKNNQLGGMAAIGTIPPHKYEIKCLIDYFITQLEKLKVNIRLGKETGAEEILKNNPKVVIIATGAEPVIPGIPGERMGHVVTAIDVLAKKAKVGDKVVIIGGGQTGIETAESLAEKGKEVTVLEMLPEVGLDMELFTRIFLLQRLTKAGVTIRTNTKVDEITKTGVIFNNGTVEADTVVLAVGLKSVNGLYASLKNKVEELYAIGDCLKPRKLLDAIHEGARVARQI